MIGRAIARPYERKVRILPKTLPDNATPASRRLYDLAVRLADSCPPEFASEIALVGSASMGLSDEQSDLDINFWSEAIPPEADRVAWLESMGATNFNVQPPRQDASYPLGCVIDGIDVGCSWQTLKALDFFVELVSQGVLHFGSAETRLETLADVLIQATPLRSTGRIAAAQAQLAVYPDFYRQQRIYGTLNHFERHLQSIRKYMRYGDELHVNAAAGYILMAFISLLYPINRRWNPQAKWEYRLAADLPLKPPNLYERIGLALHDPNMRQRPIHLARLMLDTLALIKDEYDVSAAVAKIETFIKENS
jgi:hypothetical protein